MVKSADHKVRGSIYVYSFINGWNLALILLTSKKYNHFNGRNRFLYYWGALGLHTFPMVLKTKCGIWYEYMYMFCCEREAFLTIMRRIFIWKKSYLESFGIADLDNETINWRSNQTVYIYVEYIHYFNVFSGKKNLRQMYIFFPEETKLAHFPVKKI